MRLPVSLDDQGAEAAQRDAFVKHYEPLVRLAVLLTGSRDAGEDVVQDVFANALVKVARLPVEEQFPYLRASVWNAWRNVLRRRSIERKHRSDAISTAREADVDDRADVWSAIRRLPTRQRACIVLRYYEDLSELDAAGVLGCSVGTVKSQTSRALSRLRKDLGDESGG